jgi:hypothetical protein
MPLLVLNFRRRDITEMDGGQSESSHPSRIFVLSNAAMVVVVGCLIELNTNRKLRPHKIYHPFASQKTGRIAEKVA